MPTQRFSIFSTHPFLLVVLAAALAAIGACNSDRAGDFYMNQGQFQAAIPCYRLMTTTAAVLDRNHHRLADAYTNLGVCYAKIGDAAEADQAQQIALQLRHQRDREITAATMTGAVMP